MSHIKKYFKIVRGELSTVRKGDFYQPDELPSRSRIGSIQGSTPTSRPEILFPLFLVICYLMR